MCHTNLQKNLISHYRNYVNLTLKFEIMDQLSKKLSSENWQLKSIDLIFNEIFYLLTYLFNLEDSFSHMKALFIISFSHIEYTISWDVYYCNYHRAKVIHWADITLTKQLKRMVCLQVLSHEKWNLKRANKSEFFFSNKTLCTSKIFAQKKTKSIEK